MDDLNSQMNNQQKAKSVFSGPKIVFIILGVIIFGELIYAVRSLTVTSSPGTLPIFQPSPQSQNSVGKISLTVSKSDFSVNETVPVSVIIDTASNTVSGADLIIHYDPKVLDATAGGVLKGKIFDEYPFVSVDPKKGLISISGISNLKNSFKGKGEFALLNLRAKAVGKTSLLIDFKKGSTTNSNLVDAATSKNILEQVDNLELNIQ